MTEENQENRKSQEPSPDDDAPDYDEILRESQEEEMNDIWQEDFTVFENISNAISCNVLLPDYAIQNPVLSAFIILPQPVLNLSPNVWIQGPSGSGKSQPISVARFLYRCPVPFATSSAVGLRNVIVQSRYSRYHPSMPEE